MLLILESQWYLSCDKNLGCNISVPWIANNSLFFIKSLEARLHHLVLPKYYCGLQNQAFFASLSFLLALALRLSGVNRKEFALNDINAFFGRKDLER